MNSGTDVAPAPQLHRALGTLDLVLLNVAAIVGLRWLSVAAQIGPSSLTLWAIGLITFLVPSGLTVLELSSRLPGEGGVYIWSKAAFGDLHGFIAGWSYWISNLVFFPSLLLFAAAVLLYVPGGSWLALADNPFYNGAVSLAILWFATLMNIVGLERAKWLQNAGGMATWLVGALILCGGVAAWYRFGAATPIATAALLPELKSLSTLASFATIALAYSGLELGPILGGEIKDPQRTIPRALLIACVAIAVSYIAGTAALFAALPAQQINAISGVPQALTAVAARAGAPALGIAAAVLLTVASMGGLGAWITGTARLPFLFGLDRYLPRALGAVHPKFGSPHVALLAQGGLTTVVLLAAISGSAVREAYIVLIDMTVILTFLPLLYMFAALPMLRRRSPGSHPGVIMIPGGPVACWLVAGSGFSVTLLAVLFAMLPPVASTNRTLFAVKVVGGCATLIGAGLVFYFRARRRAHL
ncbi:MAG: APC family permease [Pseudomonadota bacterium]|nr:APC family permease [Pseudomonadota bacterium]